MSPMNGSLMNCSPVNRSTVNGSPANGSHVSGSHMNISPVNIYPVNAFPVYFLANWAECILALQDFYIWIYGVQKDLPQLCWFSCTIKVKFSNIP